MRYSILICGTDAGSATSVTERAGVPAAPHAVEQRPLLDDGRLESLACPACAPVLKRAAESLVVDGPFIETKELLLAGSTSSARARRHSRQPR